MSYNRNIRPTIRNKEEKPARMLYLKALRIHHPAWGIEAESLMLLDTVMKVFHSYN